MDTKGQFAYGSPEANFRRYNDLAECSGEDPDLFFPDSKQGESNNEREIRVQRAIMICRRCPIIDECLQYALTKPEDIGIWGGKTEEERRRIKKMRT